jgi:hypothetical protein
VTELEPIVDDAGVVVLGLFNAESDEGVAAFRNVSQAQRGHTRFAISTSSALSQSLAEHFEVRPRACAGARMAQRFVSSGNG